MKNKFALLTAMALTGALWAGTAAFAQEEAEAQPQLQLGERVTDADYEIIFINETGKTITDAALRINYAETFGESLMGGDAKWEDQEKAVLYCTPGEMVNYVPAVYDLQVTFDGGEQAVLHTLPFGDAKEVTILTAEKEDESENEGEDKDGGEDITYVRFTSLSLGYETDNLHKETEIAEIGEAVLVADYQAKVSYTYSAPSSGGGDGGSSGGGGGEPQQCLDNGILF